MYGMESGQEFLAGWTDGMLAAKVAMRNAVRGELVRYALELTVDDGVVPSATPEPVVEKVPGPDNPLGDQDYTDGWIYAIIREGGRSMPPFAHSMSVSERWSLVHYVKTFEVATTP